MSNSRQQKYVRRLRSLIKLVGSDQKLEHVSRVFPTRTLIDVGSWFGHRKVWVCVLEADLLLVARGRRPHVERVPFHQLRDSLYNHVTGELVLGPAEGVQVTRLRLPPLEAVSLLKCIGVEVEQDGARP